MLHTTAITSIPLWLSAAGFWGLYNKATNKYFRRDGIDYKLRKGSLYVRAWSRLHVMGRYCASVLLFLRPLRQHSVSLAPGSLLRRACDFAALL